MEDTNSRASDSVPPDLEGPMATGTGALSDDRQVAASDGATASRGGVAKVDFAKVYGLDKTARAALNMGSVTATVRGPVRGLDDAATTLLETLGIEAEVDDSVPILLPSDDDLAYDVISEADSDLAQAVDMAAGKVRTSFWNTRQVRNALAWMLVVSRSASMSLAPFSHSRGARY